jgi:hypothetical protein
LQCEANTTIVAVQAYVAILVGHNLKDVVKNVAMLLCECEGATCMGMGVDEHHKKCREHRNVWEHCNFEWNFVIKMFTKGTMKGATKH